MESQHVLSPEPQVSRLEGLSIPIGAATGAGGTIVAGSELLVIQMQDASINTTNSVVYGNGSTGNGFTTINNAGNYEYVTATGTVSGGAVPIAGAGTGGGLVFGYTSAAASATKGRSTFQVVLVPQYASATLGAATASAWNGSTGGILALDIAGQLDLGSATVSVDGLGFRGGAGMQLQGGAGANTDYRQTAPATYGGVAEAGGQAAKERALRERRPTWSPLAPIWRRLPTIRAARQVLTPACPGEPRVTREVAEQMPIRMELIPEETTRMPAAVAEPMAALGGFGGDSWNSNLSSGGEGGATFPSTIDRLALGGWRRRWYAK